MSKMTKAQAKAEIAVMQIEIKRLLQQIKRDREEGQIVAARINATMARVEEGLKRLQER